MHFLWIYQFGEIKIFKVSLRFSEFHWYLFLMPSFSSLILLTSVFSLSILIRLDEGLTICIKIELFQALLDLKKTSIKQSAAVLIVPSL